jgi:glucose-1-phosphate thymidylyltransferase
MHRVEKAVIMARGLGTRMRSEDGSARLDQGQSSAAAAGVKAMIPIGRPFLDYVLSALADAGYRRVCLVIGPEHGLIRDYYEVESPPGRIGVDFAIQEKPLGTADAVLAAESFVGGDLFLLLNSDNYYPPETLAAMGRLDRSGIALFERDALVASGNIPEERVLQFAVAKTGPDGFLERIIEKPSADAVRELGLPVLVSMNCWVFSPAIFEACRSVRPSARGELELTDAAEFAMKALGEPIRALTFRGSVLDLSSRSDIAPVAEKLKNIQPNP